MNYCIVGKEELPILAKLNRPLFNLGLWLPSLSVVPKLAYTSEAPRQPHPTNHKFQGLSYPVFSDRPFNNMLRKTIGKGREKQLSNRTVRQFLVRGKGRKIVVFMVRNPEPTKVQCLAGLLSSGPQECDHRTSRIEPLFLRTNTAFPRPCWQWNADIGKGFSQMTDLDHLEPLVINIP